MPVGRGRRYVPEGLQEDGDDHLQETLPSVRYHLLQPLRPDRAARRRRTPQHLFQGGLLAIASCSLVACGRVPRSRGYLREIRDWGRTV